MIKLESNGTFTVSFHRRDPVTRLPMSRRRKNIKSRAEANRIYQKLIIELNNSANRQVQKLWPEVLDEYLNSAKRNGMSLASLESYSLCLKAHTLPDWLASGIEIITGDQIRDIIHRKVGHRSESHKKNMRKFINAVFTYAVEKGYIKHNPTPTMHFRIGDKIKKVLTEPQVKILLDSARDLNSEWHPHWALALFTGMRNGELYALTWDKVNLDEQKILVDSSWNNKSGMKDTKSGDDRIIGIAPQLLDLLKKLKMAYRDSNFVLPRIEKWDKGEQARELRMFLIGLKLPAIRFHDLRATWATLLLSKGVEPIKVMILGGWKDLKTLQIYVRKAGVNTKGSTDVLNFHDSTKLDGKLIQIKNSLY